MAKRKDPAEQPAPDTPVPEHANIDVPPGEGEMSEQVERVKFEWPDAPNGDLLLHAGFGYAGRKFARFFGGFYITSDADEIAALRARAGLLHDVYEVPMSVTDRAHKPTSRTPPPIPE